MRFAGKLARERARHNPARETGFGHSRTLRFHHLEPAAIFPPLPIPGPMNRHRPDILSGLLLLAALAGGCRDGSPGEPGAAAPGPASEAPRDAPPPAPGALGEDACRDAGYLCAGLAAREEPRVLRWSSATGEIRVHVPLPSVQPRGVARELQDAAVAGILAWQGTPFTLRVDRRASTEAADIVVEWVDVLGGSQLGRAETEWTRDGDGRMAMRVRRFALAVLNPLAPDRPLDPGQVRLAAAHEMGHALGLPHSDSRRDVMYPTNTAGTLSARDYETMAALYRLENGALLPPARDRR